MLRYILSTGMMVLLLLWTAPVIQAQEEPVPQDTEAAQEAAEEWLALTDAGEFGQSWEEAGELLQSAVTREEWVQQGEMLQEQLDPVTSREFGDAQYTQELPDAPEGEYTFIQYNTMFGEMATIEIVVLNLENDAWKVIGYQVQPAQPEMPQGG